jgi:hypothetical protein
MQFVWDEKKRGVIKRNMESLLLRLNPCLTIILPCESSILIIQNLRIGLFFWESAPC